MNLHSKSILALLGLCTLIAAPVQADVNSDLAFSNFTNVDLNTLANGTVVQERGGLIYFQHGIITQSLYVVDASPADVRSKLATWNPADHAELKVWAHTNVPSNPKPSDFASLSRLPDNSSINNLITASSKYGPSDTSLQVSKQEAQLLSASAAQGGDAKGRFVNVWSQILSGRFTSFLGGHLGSDSYSLGGAEISPLSEIRNLLHSDNKVYIQFQKLFNQTPIKAGGSSKALQASLYYQSFDIEGTAALVNGAMYQAANGTSFQSADIDFYINYGVFATIELEQIWPVTINGKNESLVWRDDLVSAPSIAYLHGTERLASGMIMLQDVKQNITAFRSEFR